MFPENVYEPALGCAELLLDGVGKGSHFKLCCAELLLDVGKDFEQCKLGILLFAPLKRSYFDLILENCNLGLSSSY
jgi:hypothetical protein